MRGMRTNSLHLWLAAVAGLAMTASTALSAETPPWKDQLPAAQAAEGWLRLSDGATTFGWTARGEVKWKAADGVLACEGEGRGMLRTTTEFCDFVLKLQYRLPADGKAAVMYGLRGRRGGGGGGAGTAKREELAGKGDQWQDLEIKAEGARGFIGIMAAPKLELRNILLKPANAKPVFNGKDLTGWKPLEGKYPSKFAVVDGCLNITNGPGDIQTEAQWKDFCLQLAIKSDNKTAKPLNSGVFFRAEPGKFWQGYEAQIRNEFKEGDRTKPVDFGTGAIYNRIAARAVVPSENEWYTMTVIAAGNHLSTWVNGYQTVDYADPNEPGSPRQNKCRTEAGVISLQGHDPTTNMLFKDIRIEAYPELKAE